MSLMVSLMRKIDAIAREQGGVKIAVVRVKLGALSHISPGHFREHFEIAARGGFASEARLEVRKEEDETAPDAQEIVLESVDVEVEEGEGEVV